MAASATLKKEMVIHGAGGCRIETGVITFDSDATVEVPTRLGVIYGASFVLLGSGGEANVLSIDESQAGDGVSAASGSKITVDATASNSNTYLYTLYGR